MNAAPAPEMAGKEMATQDDTDDEALPHRASSKRNAAENVGLVCAGALLLAAAARGALDLGLAAEARTALSFAACCAVLAGAAFLFRDAIDRLLLLRGRRRREPPQQQQPRPPAPATSAGVRRKIDEQPQPQAREVLVLDEPSRPSTSDRMSRSPSSKGPSSCDGGPHEATTAHEPMTPEPAATCRRTSTTAHKLQLGAEKQLTTTPEPSPLRRTSRPRKPSRRYSTGDWVL